MSRERHVPQLGTLDPADWTTEEIARHVCMDAHAICTKMDDAQRDHKTDTLLTDLQNYYGKIRSWLQLYSAVTKQEIVE